MENKIYNINSFWGKYSNLVFGYYPKKKQIFQKKQKNLSII